MESIINLPNEDGETLFRKAQEIARTMVSQELICFRCGMCCRYGVCLSLEEAEAISRYTGLPPGAFLESIGIDRSAVVISEEGFFFSGDYDVPYWLEPPFFHTLRRNSVCFFLEHTTEAKTTRCLVHPVKPVSCQTYSCSLSREWCQKGLSEYWGLAVSPSGELSGSPEKLRRFRLFLESIKD
ncbi:MAG: YkgJ family cysteine cluster protein [Chloroflexota bacterium]